MPIEILMPALSPTMKEGNLARWLKKEGDKIKAGEVIAEIETDKATMEVEAVDEGILGKIIIAEGSENVAVNSLIALILEEGEDKKSLINYAKDISNESPKSESKLEIKEEKAVTNDIQNTTSISTPSDSSSHIKASPLAKRIAKDSNINLASLVNLGTGPKGRIIKDDLLEFAAKNTSGSSVVRRNNQEFTAIKNNNIRKIIAKRLTESKQTIPHFYLSAEFKIDRLLDMRASLNEAAEIDANGGNPAYKISVNDLIIKASAMALKKVPQANSAWSDEAILLYNNVDIAVAVSIDGGLITPIVRNADQKSIPAISSEVKILAKKARENKLQPEEFQGGSFSISNLGMYGIDNFNAIINPPQSCILAIGRGVEKPIAEHGQIKIANMVNITLSCDHRLVDGVIGAEFLKALRRYIEHPVLMLNF
jgi:pyruvate dehydrogenase E2 component (dihydrolipoamide acetyltransferase)